MPVLDLPQAPAGTSRDAYDAFADLYDAFTWDHDYERWVTTLERVARSHGLRGHRLLDVACGTGKSIVPWLERGYGVEGCDLSARMLERAVEKTGGRARVVVADMRLLPSGEPVDLVTCLGDSLNYLLDPSAVRQAFAAASGRLRPGGLYLFDLNSLRTHRQDFGATRRFERDGWDFCWTGHASPELEPGERASATVTARRHGASGPPAMTSRHDQRHHPMSLVRAGLEWAGMECAQVCRQHRDGSLDPEFAELTHSKAVVVARKPAPR